MWEFPKPKIPNRYKEARKPNDGVEPTQLKEVVVPSYDKVRKRRKEYRDYFREIFKDVKKKG